MFFFTNGQYSKKKNEFQKTTRHVLYNYLTKIKKFKNFYLSHSGIDSTCPLCKMFHINLIVPHLFKPFRRVEGCFNRTRLKVMPHDVFHKFHTFLFLRCIHSKSQNIVIMKLVISLLYNLLCNVIYKILLNDTIWVLYQEKC